MVNVWNEITCFARLFRVQTFAFVFFGEQIISERSLPDGKPDSRKVYSYLHPTRLFFLSDHENKFIALFSIRVSRDEKLNLSDFREIRTADSSIDGISCSPSRWSDWTWRGGLATTTRRSATQLWLKATLSTADSLR